MTSGIEDGKRARKADIGVLVVNTEQQTDPNIEQALAAERSYFDVRTETDPEEALDRTEREPIDVVVGTGGDDRANGVALLRRLRENEQDVPFVLLAASVDPETAQTVQDHGGQWLQTNGEPAAMIPVLADIIEEERTIDRGALSALEAAESRYETLTQTLPDIVFVTDYDSRMLFANDELERQTGLTVEDFQMSQDSNPFIHPEDQDRLAAAIGEFTQSDRRISKPLDNRFIDNNGEVHWFTSRVGKVTYEGEPALQFVTQDITSRRGSDDMSDERWHRSLLDRTQRVASVGGYEYDVQAENLLWTDGMYDLLEFETKEDPAMSAMIDYFHPDDRERVEESFERAIHEADPFQLDAKLVTEAETLKWVRFQGEPLPRESDDIERLRGALVDITDRKEYELELTAAKRELERHNEQLEQFASFVSHDLRNPLNVAQMYAEMAEGAGDQAAVEEVIDALDRMEAIIEEALTLAREGQSIEETEMVDLSVVATEAWQHVDTESVELAIESDDIIVANHDRILRLFENLYRNAVEHAGDEPTIRVGTFDPPTDAQERQDAPIGEDQLAGLYIADDGPGIPEDQRDEIFEVGYTTEEEGTGFGLGIVKQIAEAHGWEVGVTESQRGGARFEFTGIHVIGDESGIKPKPDRVL